MYEEQLQPMAAKAQPRHMEFAETVMRELLQFDPAEQNEVVTFWRKVSIEERQRKADQLKKEAEALLVSCEGLK